MIRFILNNTTLSSTEPPGTTLVDFIRYHQHLTGTKIGCREGDCGACTVLIGELDKAGKLNYLSATSCLTALGNIHHKHIVTVEGLNMEGLNPIQQAMCSENGTQCGFCTPGFVVSLAGFCLTNKQGHSNAIAAMDGNICRCTGYKSIERAAKIISGMMEEKGSDENSIDFVTARKILPDYFASIRERLQQLSQQSNGLLSSHAKQPSAFLGGGTDLYVQQHEEMVHANVHFLFNNQPLKNIYQKNNRCYIGGASTVSDLSNAAIINEIFPRFDRYGKLVSSTPIRNIATIAGNIVNASPIGDFSIFLLALNAHIILTDVSKKREIPLKDFYKGYKKIDKNPEEFIEEIWFELPSKKSFFHFEKVSKRTWLDIASLNSACKLELNGDNIVSANISAGGVGPIPTLLHATNNYLKGKLISATMIKEAIAVAQTEISPISDTRGTAEYKRFLLGQLIKAHFLTAVPHIEVENLLTALSAK